MWYVLGFLLCLGFVWIAAVVLVGMHILPPGYLTGGTALTAIIQVLKSDPFAGSAVQRIDRWVAWISSLPVLGQVVHLLGVFASIVFSPVGLVALGLLWILIWLIP